jgi:FixJ family two-component response regulator
MAVTAMKSGAVESLTKPFRDQDLLPLMLRLNAIARGVIKRGFSEQY